MTTPTGTEVKPTTSLSPASKPKPTAVARPEPGASRKLSAPEELEVLIRALPDHLRRQLGRRARRAVPATDRRVTQQETLCLDTLHRSRQIGIGTAARQIERDH